MRNADAAINKLIGAVSTYPNLQLSLRIGFSFVTKHSYHVLDGSAAPMVSTSKPCL